MRWLAAGAAVLAGLVAGAVLMLGLQDAPAVDVGEVDAAPVAVAPQPPPADVVREPVERVLLAWTPGGLPRGLARTVARLAQVDAVTVVRGGLVELNASADASGRPVDVVEPGFVIPLDAMA